MDNNLVEHQPVEENEPPDPFAGGAGLTEQPYEGLGETVRPVRVALIPYFFILHLRGTNPNDNSYLSHCLIR